MKTKIESCVPAPLESRRASITAAEVIAEMKLRFTSGNDVPVDRAMIRREEWDALMASVDWLTGEFLRGVEDRIVVATDEELAQFMKVCRGWLDARKPSLTEGGGT